MWTRAGRMPPCALWTARVCFALLAGELMAAGQAPAVAKKGGTGATLSGAESRLKAIFEPVNYGQDLKLTDVFFVNDTMGWVSGANGTLLKTADGGNSWTAVLGGDPASKDDEIRDLRFLDAAHGWAVKGRGKLLRTSDGENWEQFGSLGGAYAFYYDYTFLSPDTAVQLIKERDEIAISRDGGKTWKLVLAGCQVDAEVDGLARKLSCRRKSLFFLSPTLGFAIGATIPGKYMVLFRTLDGGENWTQQVIPDVGHPDESFFWQGIAFNDENTGFAILPRGEKFLATSDGGKTWRGVIAQVKGRLKFSGRQVGWSLDKNRLTYTMDGGGKWLSRALAFPTEALAFSLPSPQHGYVVGDHGMIYRYRVVPADYASKGMIEAPMMPVQ
jgi:photosystem II stability/assembly factor-like uncharacterized protein